MIYWISVGKRLVDPAEVIEKMIKRKNYMKLKLLSVLLTGSTLFLTACGGDDNSDHSSTSSDVDVNKIENPVVNTPVPYNIKNDVLPPNADESVVMTYKMKGITGQETQATALVFTPKQLHLLEVGRLWLGHMERQVLLTSVHQVKINYLWLE